MSQPGGDDAAAAAATVAALASVFSQFIAGASAEQRNMFLQTVLAPPAQSQDTQPPPSQGRVMTSSPSPPGLHLPTPSSTQVNPSRNAAPPSHTATAPASNSSEQITDAYTPTRNRYTPISRPMPLPAVRPTQSQGGFQPFRGVNDLPISLTAAHTNEQRRTSMQRNPNAGRGRGGIRVASAPTPSGSRTTRRPRNASTPSIRGVQVNAPSGSNSRGPRSNAEFAALCLVGRESEDPKALLDVFVYPPTEPGRHRSSSKGLATHFALYFRDLKVSFRRFCIRNKLFYEFSKPTSTTIPALRAEIVGLLKESGYEFEDSDRARQLEVEASELVLLSMGQGNKLHPYPGDAESLTIAKMLEISVEFPAKKFGEDGRFQVFFMIASDTTGCRIGNHLHLCLAPRYRSLYYADHRHDFDDPDALGFSCDEVEGVESLSGGRYIVPIHEEDEMEVDDDVGFQALPSPSASGSATPTFNSSNAYQQPESERVPRAFGRSTIPQTIWKQEWTRSPRSRHKTLEENPLKKEAMDYLRDPLSDFRSVRGKDVDDLSCLFIAFLRLCAIKNDYGDAYIFLHTCVVDDGASPSSSLGAGVGKEVLYRSFKAIAEERAKYFCPTLDDFCSILVPQGGGALFQLRVLESLLLDFNILGALSAMMVSYGIPPIPLDPLLIECILHKGDIRSLTSRAVGEWHPGFRQLLEYFIALGPTGDLRAPCPFGSNPMVNRVVVTTPLRIHFQSHFGMDVHVLQGRTEDTHSAWAATLLVKAIFGTLDLAHPHLQAFYDGFSMNSYDGRTTQDVFDMYKEQTSDILSLIWAGRVQNADQFLSRFILSPDLGRAVRDSLDAKLLTLHSPRTVQHLVEGFFRRRGIPCMDTFQQLISPLKSPGFDLSQEDTGAASFRPRLYTWASTGTPYLLPNDPDLELVLVADPSESAYAGGTDQDREGMMRAGVLSWGTCSSRAMLPTAYLLELAERNYPHGGYASFDHAFDQWVLVQIVNGICGHSGIL
ncbi:hypothetical protein BDN72DRAFT_893603 [Pluteus cervinus]|uniref:Uncharacterized protein n=1 Tax=Pluteus cervinus TaxID=181527 RepID=A0ACD3B7R2_9AGAR|nr:hypothetical protein BDN72DRAFT_893603 [Pluteus cervinus]